MIRYKSRENSFKVGHVSNSWLFFLDWFFNVGEKDWCKNWSFLFSLKIALFCTRLHKIANEKIKNESIIENVNRDTFSCLSEFHICSKIFFYCPFKKCEKELSTKTLSSFFALFCMQLHTFAHSKKLKSWYNILVHQSVIIFYAFTFLL